MRASHGWTVVVALSLFACSGSDSGASSGDAGSDVVHGDGGCIVPTEGQSCTKDDKACQPADPCCAGYLWICNPSGTWEKSGVGCACGPFDTGTRYDAADASDAFDASDASDAIAADVGPFACGTSLVCRDDEICLVRASGVPTDGGPVYSYECDPFPAACAATPTCACIEAHAPASCTPDSCTLDASGRATLGCLGA
jgi:hypothetical protein